MMSRQGSQCNLVFKTIMEIKISRIFLFVLVCAIINILFWCTQFEEYQTPSLFIDDSINNNGKCRQKHHKILTPFFLEAKNIEKYTNTLKEDYNIRKGFKVFVNTNQKTYARRDLYTSCIFSPRNDNGPIPVLFIVNGRSGSSNTWLTLNKLAGGIRRTEAVEAFGSDIDQNAKFFNSIRSEKEGAWWINEHLCEVTKINCDSPIAGIQWKPYVNTWKSPSAQGILKQIAHHNLNKDRKGHQIKVIYMTRNPLHVLISRQKHRSRHVPAHCSQSDTDCLENHKRFNVTLPIDDLMNDLQENAAQEKLIETTLRNIGINYYRTSYEKLYSCENAEEWMNIFRYLKRGPTEGLHIDDVENAFPMVKTTKVSLESLLANYDQVKQSLDGTRFADLID